MRPRATPWRSLAALAGLTLTLPVDLGVTAAALVTTRPARPEPAVDRKTVLISGGKMTKALQLARSFSAAGHRVVLVEKAAYRLTGHRFSRAVDAFHVVPDPRDPGYADALLDVVRAEGVDLYVPVCSPVAAEYDAAAATVLAPYCEVLSPDAETVRTLDDKHRFTALAASLGLSVPGTHLVTSPEQVLDFDFSGTPRPCVLKSIAYDPVHRLDLTPLPLPTRAATEAFLADKPISPENPWILQEFVTGQEVCTHSTARDGVITVWCCCESSAFQVNYAQVDLPRVREWVTRFVSERGLTGQVSFDFIVAQDGTPYAIECNPRTHSAITVFHDHPAHPGLADAHLAPRDTPLEPVPGSRPTYWLYHELWRALSAPRTARERWRVVRAGTDAVFDRADPLPYLVLHHLQIPVLLVRSLLTRGAWLRIDVNIGKLVQPAGAEVALRVLHLVGSPTTAFFDDLSRLYAADCLAAVEDPDLYEPVVAHVSPDGSWRFPTSLGALADAEPLSIGQGIARLTALDVDVALPQMFCIPGMTHYRSLLDALGIRYVGNPPDLMALGAHKARAQAVVSAAGVRVPAGEVLSPGEEPTLVLPVVVKPVDADNSVGVTLVRDAADYGAALAAAWAESDQALVEDFVPLGREVRCGVVVRDGELVALPLEEYGLTDGRPVRTAEDKIRRADDGTLGLMAKDTPTVWIVDVDDPVTAPVWAAARASHRALGCRDYSLFDFRVDPDGVPWFLEAGLYNSFARQSVIPTMARAAGIELPELFAAGVAAALAR